MQDKIRKICLQENKTQPAIIKNVFNVTWTI